MKTTEFLKENATITQESPEDTSMVKNNLHTIMRVTADLASRLKGNEDLDEWIKEKIAVAKSMMVTVEDYIASQQEMGGNKPAEFNIEIAESKFAEILGESKSAINFDADDLKRLERIRDLPTLKAQALELISKPSAKPMKPEKVEWFKNALENMNSPMRVIKLMYDLLLSGEGNSVIGSKSSMNPNSYRQRFGEEAEEMSVACIVDYDRGGQAIVRRSVPVTKERAEEIIANARAKNTFTHPPFMTIYPASAGRLDGETIMSKYPDMSSKQVNENASGGATGASSVAVVSGALGEQGGFSKKDVDKKLSGYGNMLTRGGKVTLGKTK